jgi:peroxiredoxin
VIQRLALLLMALAVGGVGCRRSRAAVPYVGEGAELIGTAAPEWNATDWMASAPLSLAALRGKVVLVRWFTATDCPFCSATAPALNQLHREFSDRGLVVIGMYHHKRSEPLDPVAVRGWVQQYGFSFPVAIDRDWQTLRRWWLDGHDRPFTSVSFLIDRAGIIRRIHPGGTMALGAADYVAMHAAIDELLAAPAR